MTKSAIKYASLSALFHSANAGYKIMEKSWKTAELAETYNENDPQPRFLGLSETVSPLEMIDETGCWCNFQDGSALNGKGQPQRVNGLETCSETLL